MITENTNNEMRIYIADLAEYNAGNLKGIWIDLPNANLWNEVQEMLGTNEEWSIHDYDLPFSISEYEDLDELNTLAEKYEDLDETDIKKINFLIENNGATFDQAIESYEDTEIYEDMTMKDLAYELVDQGCFGEIPDHLACYIDYDAIANDLGYDYTEIGQDIFRSA